MLFNSVDYAIFLPFAVAAFWLIPRRLRLLWLLGLGYLFYMHTLPRGAALLAAVTVINYTAGLLMGRRSAVRKLVLFCALALDLGVLGFFKYADFVLESANSLVGALDGSTRFDALNIILPIGISFYTFYAMAYLIDCYRGRFEPVRRPDLFAAHMAFFPQILAGPIVRPDQLLPQLTNLPAFRRETFESGIRLVVVGIVKKVLLADKLAVVAGMGFSSAGDLGMVDAWVAALAFTFQIYFDFSGYTDIARGSARLFSIELPENFRLPYLADSPREFWRKWHITLSTWFRDYLYIPLGGSKGGRAGTYRNLMITMVLAGLWHGAAWTFVIWGAYHGVILVANHILIDRRGRERPTVEAERPLLLRAASIVFTFVLVVLGWVFFRAESISQAMLMFSAMVRPEGPGAVTAAALGSPMWGYAALLLAWHAARQWVQRSGIPRPALVRLGTYSALVVLLLSVVYTTNFTGVQEEGKAPTPFIYFRF
ncbi:MBOAT family O-acyltransferase [Thermodesulfobacteriota bacterium]